MKKTKLVYLAVTLFLISVASSKTINLKENTFEPEKKSELSSKSLATVNNAQSQSYNLLQFEKPTNQRYRQKISKKGVEFLSYIPQNAWLIKLNTNKKELLSEEKVKYIGPYKVDYKINSKLQEEISEKSGRVQAKIEFFPQNESVLNNLLEAHSQSQYKFGPSTWTINTTYSNLDTLVEYEIVKKISVRRSSPKTAIAESRDLIEVDQINSNPYGLEGRGFTAAMWDSGWAGNHTDLEYSLPWTNTGKTIIGDSGYSVGEHGTHVAGIMLGGGKINSNYRGVAPDSRLISYEWPVENGASELYPEINESAVKYNAIVSQNSWSFGPADPVCNNTGVYGNYNYWGEYYDSIVAGETNQVDDVLSVVFSAGNERGTCGLNYNTTAFPGTSKNAITVGSVDDSAQVASYSSWGPTDDGRIKPTIMADGGECSTITSTIPGDSYGEKCGTSMSAPAVSGSILLINQYFNQTYNELPSPSTVKGLLIQNAQDLNRTGPDYITGWGLVNATRTVQYIDTAKSNSLIKTGNISTLSDSHSYNVSVPKGESVNFTLVWSDYPGDHTTSEDLRNDLNLIVETPSGKRHYPWTLSWENRTETAIRTRGDHTNVVEQVTIDNATSNHLNIAVNASRLPDSPQNYSLLLSSNAGFKPNLTVKSPENNSYSVIPEFKISSDIILEDVKFSIDGSGNYSMVQNNSTYYYNKSLDLSEGHHNVVFWGSNTNDYWGSENVSFVLDTQSPNLTVLSPIRGSNISGIFEINASAFDSTTSVVEYNYNISNSTYSEIGVLNTTYYSETLEDGKYNFTFMVYDEAGNYNNETRRVIIDNSDPQISSLSPLDESNISGNFSINGSASDNLSGIEKSYYEIGNSTLNNSGSLNASINITNYAGGEYNVTYIFQDYAGNIKNKTAKITLDTQKPYLTILNPTNKSYISGNLSLSVSSGDKISGVKKTTFNLQNRSYQINGSLNSTINTSSLSESEYNITFEAQDYAGNKESKRINFTLDNSKPSINIISPAEKANLTNSFSINATTTDSVSGIKNSSYALFNSTNITRGKLNTSLNTSNYSEGRYTLNYTAYDYSNNSITFSRGIRFDNSPPEIVTSTVTSNDELSGTFELNTILKEATKISIAQVRISTNSENLTDWKDLNTTFDSTKFEDGTYNLEFEMKDTLGNSKKFNYSISINNKDASGDNLEDDESTTSGGSSSYSYTGSYTSKEGETEFNESQNSMEINASKNATESDDNNSTEINASKNATESDDNNSTRIETNSEKTLMAFNPEKTICSTFEESEKPDNWTITKDCGQWKKQMAEKLIKNISNTQDQEKLAEARSKLQEGKYTEAIAMASEIRSEEKIMSKNNNRTLFILFVLALAAITSLLVIYFILRRKMLREVTRISTKIKIDKKTGEKVSPKSLEKLKQAEKSLKQENLFSTWKKIRKLKEIRS